MKIVITGSLGNIGRNLTRNLVNGNHDVTVVTSDEMRKPDIETLGAKAAVGSIADVEFLARTFRGADSIFTMIPPSYTAADFPGYIKQSGRNYVEAVRKSGVSHVVNLSTIGANLTKDAGPLSAMHHVENYWSVLEDTNVMHVRPGYFYSNYFWDIPLIQSQGIIGGNYPEHTRMVAAHPADIADIVTELLETKSFSGHDIRYIASDDLLVSQAASLLKDAVGKPNLPWIQFPDDALAEALAQNGFSESAAQGFVEMGRAFAEGECFREYDRNPDKTIFGKRTFSDFVHTEFKAAFNA